MEENSTMALGVEEWAFVTSALENEAPCNVQLDSDRSASNQQREADNQMMMLIENKRLKAELEQLAFAKQHSDYEAEARIVTLERENQQLHKMWKDQVTKRLDLEKKLQRLSSARTKQLKESKRLRSICLHQAAALFDLRQKQCQRGGKSLALVVEQEKKVETMGQWLINGLKTTGKRCRKVDMLPVKELKRLKESSPETQAKELVFEADKVKKKQASGWNWKVEMNKVKGAEKYRYTKASLDLVKLESRSPSEIHAAETEFFGSFEPHKELEAAQLQLETDTMIGELNVDFDWYVESPLTG